MEKKTEILKSLYDQGRKLGLKHGKISRLDRMIQSDTFTNIGKEQVMNEIVSSCICLEEFLPEEFLMDGDNNFGNLERKHMDVYLAGYTEGRNKHIRNKADKKYHKKVGLVSKTYKLHENVVDEFAEACEKNETSLGSTLENLMKGFIDEVNSRNESGK